MSYERQRIDWDSYYNPPDPNDICYVTIWVEPGSVTDDAITAYRAKRGGSEEEAVHALIEAGFTALLENDALDWTGHKE